MSLYGNVKKVNSSVFQFDKIYSNRADLEDNENNDGVYIGRYVLVEYGERFAKIDGTETTETLNNTVVVQGTTVKERPEYRANANKDLTRFGAIYDSTVWQKIYFQGHDKYIMVAELNAIAPKLDMSSHSPITYIKTTTDADGELLAGDYDEDTKELKIIKLTNAKEKYNNGYFDAAMDTEISYLLHYPETLQIEAGDNTINYNKKAFNPVYSYGEIEGPSTIALLPEIGKNYTILTENGVPRQDHSGNYLGQLKSNTDINKKTLFINFPAFGNAMDTIYNLIYGIPDTSGEQDLKNGILRTYFKQFLREVPFTNKVNVKNSEGNYEPLLINEEPQYVTDVLEVYSSLTNNWEPVVKTFEYSTRDEIVPKTISPNFIVVKYKDNNGNFYDVNDMQVLQGQINGRYVLYNSLTSREFTWIMEPPQGEENQEANELDKIPTLEDLVKTNATGLASVLRDLFGVKDPITGLSRYFLYNDWTADSNGEDNTPMILNKPYVVGGYQESPEYVQKIVKTFDSNGVEEQNQKQFFVLNTNTSTTFSGGHYKIDFDTWQLTTA